MKKHFAILLVTALLTGILCGCGSSGNDNSQKITSTTGLETSDENVKGSEQNDFAEETETAEQESEPAEESQPEPIGVTIDETVIMDEGGIKVTAKEFKTDGFFGPEITMLIENDSGKDITVQTRNSSVNGYMIDTSMSADVVNGKKSNESMSIMQSDLKKAGIETIADIEFALHVFDSSSWDAIVDTDQIVLKTSAADGYQYSYDDSGDLAYDGNDIKIIVKGLSEDDSIFGPGVVLYIENNGDKAVTVQSRDVSINGFMMDPIFSSEVMPGKRAIDGLTFMSSELEDNGIETISDVELSFHIFETDGWDTIADTDTVTIHF